MRHSRSSSQHPQPAISDARRLRPLPALVAAIMAFSLVACSTTQTGSAMHHDTVTGDRAGDMAADLVIVRPLGIIGTVLGATGFILSLPFTLPSGSAGDVAHELVGKPFEYTFNRPLGEFDRCGADREPCGRR